MGDANHSHEKTLNSNVSCGEQYNEIIIDLTRERINQLIGSIQSTQTKGGLIIGFSITVISIILNSKEYLDFLFNFEKETWKIIIAWLPMVLLTIAVASCIPLLFVRFRFHLIKPRETNNDHVDLSIPQLKNKIKGALITSYEIMQKRRKHDWLLLNIAISSLIGSAITIFITLILQKTGSL